MLNKYKCRTFLVLMMLALLSACGGQDATLSNSTNSKTTTSIALSNNASQTTVQTNTPLLANLAKQFPDGKFPSDKLEAAAKQLAQSPRILKASSTTSAASKQMPAARSTQNLTNNASGYIPIYRYIQSDLYGTYFLSKHEMLGKTTAQSIDPNYLPQGAVFEVEQSYRAGLSAVYRFRNKANNTHVDIIDPAERDYIISDLSAYYAYENIHWYASVYSYSGLKPVYRFWNTVNGSYLFTADQDEANTIAGSYGDIFDNDGVAFYVRNLSPVTPPTFANVYPETATQNVKTDFVVEGENIPLDATLSFDALVCQTPTNRTSTGFSQKCTMGAGSTALARITASGGAKQIGYRSINLVPPIVEPAYTGNLPDTGITNTQCYGIGSDVLISCTSAAAIALNPKQDGMIGRDVTAPAAADGKLGFSYSDVPKPGGGVYAKTECVKDNITGLTWEGKTASGLRSAINTYTNYDSTTEIQAWDGNSRLSATQAQVDAITNTVGYKNYVNSIALCGYTDWRLPEIAEIVVLLDLETAPNAFNADTTWLPNNWGSYYWSSTGEAVMQDSMNAWLLNLSRGGKEPYLRSVDMYVRLVRGGTTATTNRYSYLNNGTEVLDSKTKLIWRRCKEGAAWDGAACIGNATSFTHEQALIHANTQTGWRLPNIKELNSTFDLSVMWPYIDQAVSPPGRQFEHTYVSSTPNTNDSSSFWVTDGMYSRNFPAWTVKLVRNAP